MSAKTRYIVTTANHAPWLLLASVLLLVVIGLGLGRLQLESGINVFFDKSDPNLLAREQIERNYGFDVDATIHSLFKYRKARTVQRINAVEAAHQTIATIVSALVSTPIVLATGFLVLAYSDFAVNSSSELLVALAIALVLDILFLPALLIKVDRWLFQTPLSIAD